jgi:predicted ArsR family transcriptional regulator
MEQGEARSQDIMQTLELSQSAASRHLQQLSATGYLTERRCEGAKCYRLNSDRIEETLLAVRVFLTGGDMEQSLRQRRQSMVNERNN